MAYRQLLVLGLTAALSAPVLAQEEEEPQMMPRPDAMKGGMLMSPAGQPGSSGGPQAIGKTPGGKPMGPQRSKPGKLTQPGGKVGFNPQPETPAHTDSKPGSKAGLNPQPEPPSNGLRMNTPAKGVRKNAPAQGVRMNKPAVPGKGLQMGPGARPPGAGIRMNRDNMPAGGRMNQR